MRASLCFLAVMGLSFVACTPLTPEEEQQARLKYDPAPPAATTCNCTPTNGTCNADCSITCAATFGDCDGNVANGCETQLNSISNCGQCARECSCYGGATCVNGACAGTPMPNGSACSSPNGACGTGSCVNLACQCSGGTPDMAHGPAPVDMAKASGTTGGTTGTTSGTGKGSSCEIGNGAVGGMFPLLMLGLILLLRRRSRQV